VGGVAVRETMTLAGRAERVRLARAFVGGALGPGHPCGDDAVLMVSELFGNSVRHSGSGAPGQTVAGPHGAPAQPVGLSPGPPRQIQADPAS
jgi:hypothetical protein